MARQSLPVFPTWYIDFTAVIAGRTGEPLKSFREDPRLVEIYEKVRAEVLTYVEMMRQRVKIPDYEIYEPFRSQILNAILQYPTVRIDKAVMFVELPEEGAQRIHAAFPTLVISRTPLPVLLGSGQRPQEDAGLLGSPAISPEAANLPDGWVSMQGGAPAPVSEATILSAAQQAASGHESYAPPTVAVISSVGAPAVVTAPRQSPVEALAARDVFSTDAPGWARRTGVHPHPTGTFIISEEDGLATCTWMFTDVDEPEVVAAGIRLTRMPSAVSEFLVGLAARVEAVRNPPAPEPVEEFEVVVDVDSGSTEPDVDVADAYAAQADAGVALIAEQDDTAAVITAVVEPVGVVEPIDAPPAPPAESAGAPSAPPPPITGTEVPSAKGKRPRKSKVTAE